MSKTFNKQEAIDSLPALEDRMNALKGRMYMGCGFHYGKEESLEKLKIYLPDHGDDFVGDMITEISYKMFVESIEEAEKSADEWTWEK